MTRARQKHSPQMRNHPKSMRTCGLHQNLNQTATRSTWQGFLRHLGLYVIVIGGLGMINLLTDPGGYPWFLWPALGWGVGLAFQLRGVILSQLTHLNDAWLGFANHFSAYAIIIGMLMGIYLMTDPGGYPWFLWPAAGWGIAVVLHLWRTVFSEQSS